MKFVIKHEIRGRIRVQILQGRMSIEQADILQYYFNAKPYSISVKVRERLSEIVIHYDGDRETVVRDLQTFSYEKAEFRPCPKQRILGKADDPCHHACGK